MRHFLRDKKIIANEILLTKLWYIGQIYTIQEYIKKKIERIHDFLWKGKRTPTSQTSS